MRRGMVFIGVVGRMQKNGSVWKDLEKFKYGSFQKCVEGMRKVVEIFNLEECGRLEKCDGSMIISGVVQKILDL